MNNENILAGLLPLLNKVEQFRQYKANWGTYGEEAVSSDACDQARRFIAWLGIASPKIKMHVYPCCSGAIGIEFGVCPNDYAVIFSKPKITLCHGTGEDVRAIRYYKSEFHALAAVSRLQHASVETQNPTNGDEESIDEFHWVDPSHTKEKLIAGWEPTTVETPPVLPTYEELFGQKIVIDEEDD